MKSKASLVLVELAVMLLVFALAGAWCMKAFAWAETCSARETQTDQAYARLQNGAEMLKACGGDREKAAERLAKEWGAEARCTDGIWEITDGAFVLQIQKQSSDLAYLSRCQLTLFRADGGEVASLYVHWQEVTP